MFSVHALAGDTDPKYWCSYFWVDGGAYLLVTMKVHSLVCPCWVIIRLDILSPCYIDRFLIRNDGHIFPALCYQHSSLECCKEIIQFLQQWLCPVYTSKETIRSHAHSGRDVHKIHSSSYHIFLSNPSRYQISLRHRTSDMVIFHYSSYLEVSIQKLNLHIWTELQPSVGERNRLNSKDG